MTSIPASRSDLAMILAPRSWPSRPGFATTTRMGPLIAGRVYTRSRLRRREHDQDREVGGDRVEAVIDVRSDEDDRPRVDRTILVSYPDPAVPGDDVVELVLVVRRLRIGLAGTQDVEAGAHRVAAQELEVELAGRGPHGVDPVDLEDVHPRDPTEDRRGDRNQHGRRSPGPGRRAARGAGRRPRGSAPQAGRTRGSRAGPAPSSAARWRSRSARGRRSAAGRPARPPS